METILVVTRSLCGISVVKDLDPLLIGLQAFYEPPVPKHIGQKKEDNDIYEEIQDFRHILQLEDHNPGRVAVMQPLSIARLADGVRLFGRGKLERSIQP